MEEAVPQLGELVRRSRGKKKEKPPLEKNSPLRVGEPWPFKSIVMTYLQVKFTTTKRVL